MDEEKIHTQKPKEGYKFPDDRDKLDSKPQLESDDYKAAGKMKGKNTIITGADSGIGRATAYAFAKEGANVAVVDLEGKKDIHDTVDRLKEIGTKVLYFIGDVGDEDFAREVVNEVATTWGGIDTLINHAGEQHVQTEIGGITAEQLDRTFRTNIYSMFYFVKAALHHMPKGGTIINTTSVTGYKGSPGMMDYAATNGAIVSFTRSLAQNKEILDKEIRVNAVAPGPVWAPLIPTTTGETHDEKGSDTPIGRAGEPYELAPAYVYLATTDSSYVTGQVIHVNGGQVAYS